MARTGAPGAALAAGFLAAAAALGACATVAVTGAAQGISYTLTNVAYRTFTFPLERVSDAAKTALKRMGVTLDGEEKEESGYRLLAHTDELKIEVRLTKVTGKATKVAVNAKKKLVIKDRAVAVEIITQTSKVLGLPY